MFSLSNIHGGAYERQYLADWCVFGGVFNGVCRNAHRKGFGWKSGAIDVQRTTGASTRCPFRAWAALPIFFGFIGERLAFCPISKEILGIFLGATIIVVLGVFDDIYALSAKLKFPVQIVAAAVPVALGVSVDFVKIPFLQDQYLNLGWLARWSRSFGLLRLPTR